MTPVAATLLIRKHDAAKLYDMLEPWQQKELVCLIRRVCRDVVIQAQRNLSKQQHPQG